jgi:hypothetical protein
MTEQDMFVEVATLGRLETVLPQTHSPWKYAVCICFVSTKQKANCGSNLLLMNTAAQIKQLRPNP